MASWLIQAIRDVRAEGMYTIEYVYGGIRQFAEDGLGLSSGQAAVLERYMEGR
jgi:hypothetical protein